jgi:hypothetical protein
MIFFTTGLPRPVIFSASATLKARHFAVEQLLVASAAGITLTLPTPIRELSGKASYIVNSSSGKITLSGDFNTSRMAETLEPGSSVLLVILPTGASTYKWHILGGKPQAWLTWTPTLSWGTATPTVTTVARYRYVGNAVEFVLDITTEDGAGGVFQSATLPVTPADIDAYVPVRATCLVDTTYSAPILEIDAANGTAGNRKLYARETIAFTDDKSCRLSITGRYEV